MIFDELESMNNAKAIEVKVHLYPQEFPIIMHSRDIVKAYYRYINKEFDFIGIVCFKFYNVWYISAQRNMKFKHYQNIEEHNYKSYYLYVPNSDLLDNLIKQRDSIDENWREYDKIKYNHYILEGHDFYYNIVAKKVKITKVKKKQKLKNLYREWEEE